ncbi:hypothetical protein AVU38_gp083 [Ralstonia phage RSL2]|uniref:LamG domain-containing protein n=1 Tax=Ralstonia phage RSL2 TaxID=1585840 RepID=A0A0A8JB70_9CAUD|nr:hypothetical protein AVU38_gp083 [Ralstonia phage RSL2]BAQ02611.1 hypothetical protein [Ralstonia phage RSL2]
MMMSKKKGINTVLLLRFNGNVVVDASGRHSPSVVGGPGFSTTNAKFNTALSLNGANQRITIADALSDFLFNPTQAFTFEMWAKFNSWTPSGGGSQNTMFGMFKTSSPGTVGGNRYSMNYSSSGNATIYNQSSASNLIYASSPDTTGVYHHYALCRDTSGNIAYYIDGIVRGATPPYTDNNTWIADVLDVGGSSAFNSTPNAYFEEVRVSRVRRYTGGNLGAANFTLPSGPFTLD